MSRPEYEQPTSWRGRFLMMRSSASSSNERVTVRAVVTLQLPNARFFLDFSLSKALDIIWGRRLLLELISSEIDPRTGLEKPWIKMQARKTGVDKKDLKFEAEFLVPLEFGEVGAIAVVNESCGEIYLKNIVLDGLPHGQVHFTCDSWVQSKHESNQKRFFFSNKSFLPSKTPSGLIRLREEELVTLRGNRHGKRNKGERIYDYDVYNDLGEPDTNPDKKRPVLGGILHPYPRRCYTGRPRTTQDPSSETRDGYFYVPRDEEFSDVKDQTFSAKKFSSLLHALLPSLETYFIDKDLPFPLFSEIDGLFHQGIAKNRLTSQGLFKYLLPNIIKSLIGIGDEVLKFKPPQTMERDRFFWFRDEEFARQTLAGLHPCHIQLVQEWPLRSKLDPEIYGPTESAITKEMIEQEIKGYMTVKQAIEQKKLFILDYHDLLLPFVKQVRELKKKTLYGSRTLFFLTPDGILRTFAIELTRPPIDGKPQWKQAYFPSFHSTSMWLWRLAKAHVLAHDSAYHQLISHWLRTHCCTEPYIIAANRQLSAMHPIYRLLSPHFRYTMEINALARDSLINADGTIETCFSAGKYSMLLSSVVYDKFWRFDHQALPADLINRGMAVEDHCAPHGIRLIIEDYPYANDGLMLWDSIKKRVTDYVNHYYPDPDLIISDQELQSWWLEVRTVGHADKKNKPWWPELKTPHDLINIVTTIAWTASGQHAAVNFGQYTYGGYFPNRPTVARKKMPTEDPEEEDWKAFMEDPASVLLAMFPSKIQATQVIAAVDVLSNHSPDEEYIGQTMKPAWGEDPLIKSAFERFNGRLKKMEGIIDERNCNKELKNRCGAGTIPYEFLKPFSEPGVTGKGVPYSISI